MWPTGEKAKAHTVHLFNSVLTNIVVGVDSRAMLSNRKQFVAGQLRTKSESRPILILRGFVWPAKSYRSENVFVMAANDEALMT